MCLRIIRERPTAGVVVFARGGHRKGRLMIVDINGLTLGKGDLVAPLLGDTKGKISATKREDGMGFVCLKALNRPYSKGVWYAADQVQRLQKFRPKKEAAAPPAKPAPRGRAGRSAA